MTEVLHPVRFADLAGSLTASDDITITSQFIDGVWRPSTAPIDFRVISPTTERPIATLRAASDADVDDAVAAARAALASPAWSGHALEATIDIVERVCAAIRSGARHVARVQTEQMGAPITASRASIERRVVANAESNVRAARRLPRRFLIDDDEGVTLVERRPVGVVAIILPWNAPLNFEIDKVTAALLAGCTVVLKAAPEAPLEAFALATMFAEAGLPPGVLNVVAGGADVGATLVAHRGVDRVTFTGSTAAGRSIARACADRFARVNLELGGKSAAIVLNDANLDAVAPVIASANFGNAGQACHALTRVLVPERLHHDLVDRVASIASGMVIGDPRDPGTQLGPLVSDRQRTRVESYIELALAAGATVAAGGRRPEQLDRGWFFEPTVLTGVTNDMRVAREEIFGPVMSVLTYATEADAITIANDSDYGLGGSVFTADPDRGLRVAQQINTGMCAINGWGMTRSAPFGGVKESGIGREHGLWGVAGCMEVHAIRPERGTAISVPIASGERHEPFE